MSLRPPAREDLRVLARNRRFLRLLAVQGLSQASGGLYQIAVAAVVIFEVSAAQTPAQVTKVLAVTLLPFSLVGPFTGPFIDRFSRRSILVGTSVVRTGLILLLLAAVCTVGSAVAAAGLVLPHGERRGMAGIVRELRDNVRDVRDGLRVLLGSSSATYAVSSTWAMRALHGFVILAALVVGRARFDIGASGFSVVLAAVGVGGFVGALLVPGVARRVGRPRVGPGGFGLAGVAPLVGGPLSVWAAILAAVGLAGTAMTATKIASDTIIMRSIPDHYRGRAFAVYDIGYNGAFVVAALVATALRPFLSDLGIILLAGVLYLIVGGALALRRRRLPPDVEVRTYAGARADEEPREVLLDGVPVEVAETERAWSERRGVESLRCFRLRLADGRRIQVSLGEMWRLDRELASDPRAHPR